MSNVNFSDSELNLLRLHYQQEYNQLVKKLDEVRAILNKLGNSGQPSALTKLNPPVVAAIDPFSTTEGVAKPAGRRGRPRKNAVEVGAEEAKPLRKGKAAKNKRIPWAKFVLKTLKSSETPMSAKELLNAGVKPFKITDDQRSKVMSSLQATLNRLKKGNKLTSNKNKGSYTEYALVSKKAKVVVEPVVA